jgi:hypothetical protein
VYVDGAIQAADVDASSSTAKQWSKHSANKAAASTAPAASPTAATAAKQANNSLTTATPKDHVTQQKQEQANGKSSKAAAGAAAAQLAGQQLAGTAAAADGSNFDPGKFDPYQTQPGQLGAPVLPGAPHNPHFNGPPRPPCEDERCAVCNKVTGIG